MSDTMDFKEPIFKRYTKEDIIGEIKTKILTSINSKEIGINDIYNDESLNIIINKAIIEMGNIFQYKSKEKYINFIVSYTIEKYLSNNTPSMLENPIYTYFNELTREPLLTKEEEKELFTEIRRGNNYAKELVIRRNLKLVISIVKKYKVDKASILDLIQEGNIGLLKAIDRFNPDLDYKFSTYATFWIKQAISNSINEIEDSIKIPINVYNLFIKIKKAEERYFIMNNRYPTNEEISSITEIPLKDIEQLKKYNYKTISLDKEINDEENTTLQELIPSNENVEDEVIFSLLDECLHDFFIKSGLNPLEINIIILRFGLIDGKAMTLQEVANIVKKTRERVRQTEEKALLKMRKSRFKDLISNYYDEEYNKKYKTKRLY